MKFLNWLKEQIDNYYLYKLEKNKCVSCEVLKTENELLRHENELLLNKIVNPKVSNDNEVIDNISEIEPIQNGSMSFIRRRSLLTQNRFNYREALAKEDHNRLRELANEFETLNKG